MTLSVLFALLEGLRARVIEEPGLVRVQVPKPLVRVVSEALEPYKPVICMFVCEPLPWWRCWFKRHQAVRR